MTDVASRQSTLQRLVAEVPRVAVVLAVSLGLAIAANALHPMRLPLFSSKVRQPGIPAWVARYFHTLSPRQAAQLIENPKVVVVDTRDARDYRAGHLPRAISLPYHGFPQYYPQFAASVPKNASLLLYCYGTSCGLSARVAKRLLVAGYSNLNILRGGVEAWRRAGFALVKNSARPGAAPAAVSGSRTHPSPAPSVPSAKPSRSKSPHHAPNRSAVPSAGGGNTTPKGGK